MSWALLAGYASLAAAAAASLGILQSWAGVMAVRRFAAQPCPAPDYRPPVSVLKPLHGDEPLLEAALATVFAQDYPTFQLVFGVARADDPALAVVERLHRRFPAVDIEVVVCGAQHGGNRKVSNLINMLGAARHDVLVIADSDLHVAHDYLRRVVDELARPGAGLVTTLSVGLAAERRLPQRLAAAQITYGFLPGVLLARSLGRQDCLGVTMALRRETLARVGGLEALADHLADDAVLGGLVRAQGLSVGLAKTLPATTVAENTLADAFDHELRWARTIRAQAPAGYAASILQFPIAWALLAAVLSGFAPAMLGAAAVAWASRALAARAIDRALRPMVDGFPHRRALRGPALLFPLRDCVSVAVMLASYRTRRVRWRGHTMYATRAVLGVARSPVLARPIAAPRPGR